MKLTFSAAEDKNNKLMSSEGMEATEEEIQKSFGDEEGVITEQADSDASFAT